MTKNQVIKSIRKLYFGDILYGYKNGKLVNINDYNEEKDVFLGYDENINFLEMKFEDLPQTLWRA